MAIHVFGSVNIDHVHRVSHIPQPGETLADLGYERHLGGKGLNQAVAAARAGAPGSIVRLSGAIGADGAGIGDWLGARGVDATGLATLDAPTGHAVICVAPDGENSIVIHGGANRAVAMPVVEAALAAANHGDWWLVQNETALVVESAARAREHGLRVAYAAAPFSVEPAREMMRLAEMIALNEIEAAALCEALGAPPDAWPVPAVLITLGARGARLSAAEGWPRPAEGAARPTIELAARAVDPVDTTGAGDCFLGAFLAAIDAGLGARAALDRATAAAAISVTRPGAAEAMPTLAEIEALMAGDAP